MPRKTSAKVSDKLKHIAHPEAYRTLAQLFLTGTLQESSIESAWQKIPDLEPFTLAFEIRKDDACTFRKFPDYLTASAAGGCQDLSISHNSQLSEVSFAF